MCVQISIDTTTVLDEVLKNQARSERTRKLGEKGLRIRNFLVVQCGRQLLRLSLLTLGKFCSRHTLHCSQLNI